MLLLVSFVFSLIVWIVLWSLGAKSLDVWLLIVLIMTVAAAAHIVIPMLPGNRREDSQPKRPGGV